MSKPDETWEAFPSDPEERLGFLRRARNGDESTTPALRKLLIEKPAAIDVFGGDLAAQAERSLVAAAVGTDLAFREALRHKLKTLRDELYGPAPTALERLLVDRAVACWLQVQDADVRSAQAKGPSIQQADYLQRRMDYAHRRYLSALKALALVRKLALPVLQVNIARKQVNVAGASFVATGADDPA